jgi:hypothetical protein
MDGSLALNWQEAWLALSLLVTMAVIGAWAWGRVRRYRRSRIAKRALGAERAALVLLRAHGYTVLSTQVRQLWPVQHGSQCFDINLRADALVRRGKRRFIAEVKSTSLVADLKHGPTRRQLLEYAVAYGTDGVLLVDMHAQHIEEITFPGLDRSETHNLWSLLAVCLVAFIAGICLGASTMS